MENERLARLEERLDAMAQQQEQVITKLDALSAQVTHYKGVIGGIALVISCVIAAIGLAKGWLIGSR